MAYEWERGIGTPGNAGPIGDRYYGPQEWAGQDDCGPGALRTWPPPPLEDTARGLTWHPDIDAGEVDVTVTDQCEVIPSGHVPDRCDRRLAEDIAARVSGVVDVQNRLRVPRADHRSAQRRLSWPSRC